MTIYKLKQNVRHVQSKGQGAARLKVGSPFYFRPPAGCTAFSKAGTIPAHYGQVLYLFTI
jgi:hypothetical protein